MNKSLILASLLVATPIAANPGDGYVANLLNAIAQVNIKSLSTGDILGLVPFYRAKEQLRDAIAQGDVYACLGAIHGMTKALNTRLVELTAQHTQGVKYITYYQAQQNIMAALPALANCLMRKDPYDPYIQDMFGILKRHLVNFRKLPAPEADSSMDTGSKHERDEEGHLSSKRQR